MEVLFIILALILFLGMIVDKDRDNRRNFSNCFMVVIAAIVILTVLK